MPPSSVMQFLAPVLDRAVAVPPVEDCPDHESAAGPAAPAGTPGRCARGRCRGNISANLLVERRRRAGCLVLTLRSRLGRLGSPPRSGRPVSRERGYRTSAQSAGRSPRRSARSRSRTPGPAADSSVRPEVQDGIEHPGHRLTRAGANRDQQRILADQPRRLPDCSSSCSSALRHLLGHTLGFLAISTEYSTQASVVVIVIPAGTRSSPSTRVISATLAPFSFQQLAHVSRALSKNR